jgi:dienelactone hydrolase
VAIQTKFVDYEQDGKVFEGFLAWDDARKGPLPGVLVSHAWGGAGEFEYSKARALAELGYAGFAVDLYGKGIRGQSMEENAKLMQVLLDDRALLQKRMALALDVAGKQSGVDRSRMGAIGFCFGGLCVLDLARTGADLRAVASFHGLFFQPGNTQGKKIRAKVLAMHGWNDPMTTPEHVLGLASELTEAGADWQLHAYGNTMHAFTNPDANMPEHGLKYHEAADARSWRALSGFLAEVFGS